MSTAGQTILLRKDGEKIEKGLSMKFDIDLNHPKSP
jgi:hypothetical protein